MIHNVRWRGTLWKKNHFILIGITVFDLFIIWFLNCLNLGSVFVQLSNYSTRYSYYSAFRPLGLYCASQSAHLKISCNLLFRWLFRIRYPEISIKGVARGGKGGNPPPPKLENIVVENWCYFRRLYFSNKFSKKIKKYKIKKWTKIPFSIALSSEISKYSQNFPRNCVFRPNIQKINT